MKLLLDTHVVIWFITEDQQLPDEIKTLIEDPVHDCFVSVASLWEMGIKYALGKLDIAVSLTTIFDLISQSGIIALPITMTHILTHSQLPFIHRDPFDRLIIAQATTEACFLVSKDAAFDSYAVPLIWYA
ncbi:MAG: type II toxin-antitoxin system VapC family toxin [Bacteroidia bacterium]|nr:type II toxin-antitoxin system VapC family toxin [Bacteroidia bacterium]